MCVELWADKNNINLWAPHRILDIFLLLMSGSIAEQKKTQIGSSCCPLRPTVVVAAVAVLIGKPEATAWQRRHRIGPLGRMLIPPPLPLLPLKTHARLSSNPSSDVHVAQFANSSEALCWKCNRPNGLPPRLLFHSSSALLCCGRGGGKGSSSNSHWKQLKSNKRTA